MSNGINLGGLKQVATFNQVIDDLIAKFKKEQSGLSMY